MKVRGDGGIRGGGNESIRSHETRGQLARLSHRQAWDQSLAATHGRTAMSWAIWTASVIAAWALVSLSTAPITRPRRPQMCSGKDRSWRDRCTPAILFS